MAKIKLGDRPKSFKAKVTFPLLDGDTGVMELSFRYRTRTEFGAFIDELMKDTGKSKKDFSLKEILEKTKQTNADYIFAVADGWNLDEPFTKENIAQLCDEIPAAALEIMNVYRSAITEGRLGN
jgi:predicted DNA-binding protein